MRRAILIVAAGFLAACVGHGAPPPAPPRELPPLDLPPTPPPSGHGRVVLDSVEASSTVYAVEARSFAASTTGAYAKAVHLRRLCQTPCAVDLPYGQHELRFTLDGKWKSAEAVVDVQGELTAVRARMGRASGGVVSIAGLAIGVLGVLTAGGAALGWDLAEDPSEADDFRMATYGGLAALAVGTVLYWIDRPVIYPGSSTQWTP